MAVDDEDEAARAERKRLKKEKKAAEKAEKAAAKGGDDEDEEGAEGWRMLLRNKPMLILAGSLACFHLGNGAMLPLYGLAFVQNLVSAALRAAPVGQAAGTRVVAALVPRVAGLAAEAEGADLDALGSACLRLDLLSFRHESQYSRIFRS